MDLDLDLYLDQIRAFAGPRFAVSTVASLEHGARVLPILAARSSADAGAPTLLVLAGVHGDERAGIVAVPAILAAWSSSRVQLVVITPVNPVGAARGTRSGFTGHDINRDFLRFATPEARAVRAIYDEVRPAFVISLHEGPQRGAFMFTNRHVAAPLATALCAALSAGGTALATRDYFGRPLRTPGWAPATPTTRAVWSFGARWLRQQATIAYSEDRGVPEIVLEGSSRLREEAARVRPHVDLVAAVAQRMGATSVFGA